MDVQAAPMGGLCPGPRPGEPPPGHPPEQPPPPPLQESLQATVKLALTVGLGLQAGSELVPVTVNDTSYLPAITFAKDAVKPLPVCVVVLPSSPLIVAVYVAVTESNPKLPVSGWPHASIRWREPSVTVLVAVIDAVVPGHGLPGSVVPRLARAGHESVTQSFQGHSLSPGVAALRWEAASASKTNMTRFRFIIE
jgi:hypothetical protein